MNPKSNIKRSNPPVSSISTGNNSITVQLRFRTELKKFACPKAHVIKYPQFFKTCLIPKVENGTLFYVPLPTNWLHITRTVLWFLRNTISIPDHVLENVSNKYSKLLYDSMEGPYGCLVQLWLMAEKYHITELKNDVVSGFYHLHKLSDAPIGIASYVHKHTSKDSALYRLLVEVLARSCSAKDLEKYKAELGEDIIYEIGHWFMKCRDDGKLKDLADRIYHGDIKEKCALFHDHKGNKDAAENCPWYKELSISDKWKCLLQNKSYNRRK